MIHDRDPIADFIGFFHVMGRQHDSDSFAAQSLDCVPHGDPALRIEPGAGFIEEQNCGTMGDGAGNLYPLLHAAGELRGKACASFL